MKISMEPIHRKHPHYSTWHDAWESGYRMFKASDEATIFIGPNSALMYYIDPLDGVIPIRTDRVHLPLTAILDEKVVFSNCN